jgi:hypothetical protein
MDGHGRFGYLDAAGRLVVPCRFDYAGDLRDGVAFVRTGKEPFLIDAGRGTPLPTVSQAAWRRSKWRAIHTRPFDQESGT